MIYTAISPKMPTKKGPATCILCKPLILVVGGIGFEPMTSTV